MSLAPDTVEEVLSDLGRGLKRIEDKRPTYEDREDYYQGKKREIIAHPKLKRLIEKYGEGFHLNYAAVPCDALADRIDLQSLTTGDKATDTFLRERFWEPNALDDDADDIHLHAYYLGDYYAILERIETEEDDVDEDDDEETGTGVGTVELTPKDPFTTVVIYQRSNSRIPDFGVQLIERDADKGDFDAFVYYDDCTWQFTTKEGTSKEGGYWKIESWEVDLDEDEEGNPEPIPNDVIGPNGRPLFPIFHFRPDAKPYGRPVNAKMYGPQDAITKVQATQMAAMDYFGFPQRYANLDPDAETDDDIDDDFNDDGTENATGAPSGSKLDSTPGGVWLLKGVRGAGQFTPADPKGFLEPLTFQIRAGATLTRTPLYEFDLEGGGDAPSGEARRRADAPITKHAEKIKGQFGAVWAAMGVYVLAALGRDRGKKVTAVWAPSETATDKEGMELVALKVLNGIPVRQALVEAGYTQDQVDEWLPVDKVNGLTLPMSPNLLIKITEALQALGQAKTLGGVSDEQVRRMLAPYFGALAGTEPVGPITIPDANADVESKANALGQLVRAGVRQEDAARILGLEGIVFDATPVALRE